MSFVKSLALFLRRGRFLGATLVLFAATLLARSKLATTLERARTQSKPRLPGH